MNFASDFFTRFQTHNHQLAMGASKKDLSKFFVFDSRFINICYITFGRLCESRCSSQNSHESQKNILHIYLVPTAIVIPPYEIELSDFKLGFPKPPFLHEVSEPGL